MKRDIELGLWLCIKSKYRALKWIFIHLVNGIAGEAKL